MRAKADRLDNRDQEQLGLSPNNGFLVCQYLTYQTGVRQLSPRRAPSMGSRGVVTPRQEYWNSILLKLELEALDSKQETVDLVSCI